MSDSEARVVLIAGGGTAGHVLPGLAIAEALVDRSVVSDRSGVHLVGSRRGIEVDLVPPSGFGLTLLPGRGIQRRLTPANLVAASGLALAFLQALVLLARRRPAVVLSLGGYASVPCVLAAIVLRIPLVVVEQNAVPGAANRLAGRFARACAVSFPDTGLPRSTVTGNPVRGAVKAVAYGRRRPGEGASDRRSARKALGVDGRQFVLVFGGSLGARRINRAAAGAVEDWTGGPVVIEHVVGARGWNDPRERAGSPGPEVEYRPVEYEADMPTVLSAVDLVVCRAGATSVAELSAIGVPSILIPLPGAPGDHQTANAEHLERCGGARLVPDGELDGDRLKAELSVLLASPTSLEAMADGARSVGVPDAADRVVEMVADLLDGRLVSGDSSS